MAREYKRLSFQERLQIKNWIDDGLSNSEIARRLDRSRAAITQELQRNARVMTWRGKKNTLRHTYEPLQAQHRAEAYAATKHHSKRKITPRKRAIIDELILKKKWSPEQIAHGVPKIGVCTQTIYNWVLNNQLLTKVIDLPLKGKRRRHLRHKQPNTPQTRVSIEKRSIKFRPKIIDQRSTFGHWEIDGVMSPQDSQAFVITLVERKTRFMVGVKTRSRNSDDVITAIDTFMSRFEMACESMTCDRGTEFTSMRFISQMEQNYKKKLYYADPQSPGQRGTNERMNRELRRVFPSGYDFTKITQKRLQSAIRDINERPRRVLSYKTPEKMFLKRIHANSV
ncbi:IS30 family transposase [Leuconostoc citreum]|uniref:IS30 family transposase n=1 Tax=Leuconostoc citreum TaxID=33964 RepID=UPI00200AC273|nr:IS30 family transposase [Leuconostoc citreum]MCK8605717.1 IS30 family transposase [Leuconostoc citreum]